MANLNPDWEEETEGAGPEGAGQHSLFIDHSSSEATSYDDPGSIPEERRLSIDQLTEEAEADLANNNDPNNNSGADPGPDYQHLAEVGESSNQNREEENQTEKFYFEDQEEDPFAVALERDIHLILKLMPDKSYDEVRYMLESHQENPSRVQVVLNEFLEQSEEPMKARDSTSPIPVRNKAGNGLKAKNSKVKKSSNKAGEGGEGPSSSAAAISKNWSDLTSDSEVPVNRKRKQPLLDLNLDDHLMPNDQHDQDDDDENGPKKPKLDVMSSLVTSRSSRSSSGASTPKESRHKIQLSEDQLHGPFNFMDHRPRNQKSKNKASNEVKFKALSENLQQIIDEKKSPTLVDLSSEPSPVVVDLSQSDSAEIRDLFQNLVAMFPTTPTDFLEDQAEELAGKPVALERFISEHLSRDCQVPDYWKPKIKEEIIENSSVLNLKNSDQGCDMTLEHLQDNVEENDPQPGPSSTTKINQETIDLTDGKEPSQDNEEVSEEDMANKRLETLVTLFPQTDPEFLHGKAVEFGSDKDQMNRWIEDSIENNAAKEFPSRADYEKRQKEAEMLDKYSGHVTVNEILDMYDDPESYFSEKKRQVSELYKKHSLNQLKKEFRHISVMVINKTFTANNGLFVPCLRDLKKYKGTTRKTRRPDHECPMPTEIDINFLKELQYSRKEDEVKKYINAKKEEHEKLVEEAKEAGNLMECKCCYNDECLVEDMLPCAGGHLFCKECVQRASEVAIGEGKHQLACLGECDDVFPLSVLQKALKANTFSKWLSRIQIAEIEKAAIDGLEQCPFCPFATIMDTTPEENKLFACQNPDCGKESCRLCKEISHIPLRCEEVEKDAEVRKRTYIENKMTEAMIRKCWKCSKPFVKIDGCNKMTCSCGASMCYLCRQPVKDYKHFYGQGGMPQPNQTCPLWSDNNAVHERDIARGALEAKNEMDKENPEVKLKHDPAKDLDLNRGQQGGFPNVLNQEIPPGLVGVLPDDPFERQRMIREQERIEAMIRGRGGPNPFGFAQPPPPHFHHHHIPELQDVNGFVHRMGELLHLREVQRQRHRQIRRQEQLALEEFQLQMRPAPGPAQGPQAPPQAPPQQPNNRVPPMRAHLVQPALPLPPPPPAHGGPDHLPPHAHQRPINHMMWPHHHGHNYGRMVRGGQAPPEIGRANQAPPPAPPQGPPPGQAPPPPHHRPYRGQVPFPMHHHMGVPLPRNGPHMQPQQQPPNGGRQAPHPPGNGPLPPQQPPPNGRQPQRPHVEIIQANQLLRQPQQPPQPQQRPRREEPQLQMAAEAMDVDLFADPFVFDLDF